MDININLPAGPQQDVVPNEKDAVSLPLPETLIIGAPEKDTEIRREASDENPTEGALPLIQGINLDESFNWRSLISQDSHPQAETAAEEDKENSNHPAPAETGIPLAPEEPAVMTETDTPLDPSAVRADPSPPQEPATPLAPEDPKTAKGPWTPLAPIKPDIILETEEPEGTAVIDPDPDLIQEAADRPELTREEAARIILEGQKVEISPGDVLTLLNVMTEELTPKPKHIYEHAMRPGGTTVLKDTVERKFDPHWNNEVIGSVTGRLATDVIPHMIPDISPEDAQSMAEFCYGNARNQAYGWNIPQRMVPSTENGWPNHKAYGQITDELTQWLQSHLSKEERALSQLQQGFHQDVQPSQPPVSREEISKKLPNQAAYGYTFEQFRKEDSIAAADTENWLGLDGCGGWVRQSIQLGSSGNEEGVAYMKDGRVITEMAIDMADPTSELEQAVNGGRLTWQEALNIEKGLKAIGIMFPYGDSELANRRIRDNISSSARKVAQAGSEFEIQKEMRNLAMAMKQKVDPHKKYALIALPPLTPPANTQAPASGQDQSETAGIPLPDKDNREYYRLVQDYGLREAVAQTKTRDPLVTPRLFEVAAALKDKGIPAAITYEKVQRPDQLTPRHEVVVTYQDGSRGYVDFGRSADSRPGQAVLSNPLVPTKPDREDDWPYRTDQYHNRPEIAQASEKAVWGPHEVASGYIDHELLEYDKLGLIPGLLRLLHNPPNGVTKAQLEKAVAEAKRAGAAGIKQWIYFKYNDFRRNYDLVVSEPGYED